VNLRLHYRFADGFVIVYCVGRITLGEETTLLSNEIAAMLADRQRVLLNLGGVDAMDAAGLGALAELAALARTPGREIKFCSLPEHVGSLFRRTHLSRMLLVYASEEEALSARKENYTEVSDSFPGAA